MSNCDLFYHCFHGLKALFGLQLHALQRFYPFQNWATGIPVIHNETIRRWGSKANQSGKQFTIARRIVQAQLVVELADVRFFVDR
ncbi:hypothetical protein CEK28_10600 [Xenophilus sp. AP218F]|nr:hypothetical protein CEK28_10600 [Xenophilus sp. AP218F]